MWYVGIFLLFGGILSASEKEFIVTYTIQKLFSSESNNSEFTQSKLIQKESLFGLVPCEIINTIFPYMCSNNRGFLGLRATCKLFERLFMFYLVAEKNSLAFNLQIKKEYKKREYIQFSEKASWVIASLMIKKCIKLMPCLELTNINPEGIELFFKTLNDHKDVSVYFNLCNIFTPTVRGSSTVDIGNYRHENIKALERSLKTYTTPLWLQCDFRSLDVTVDQIHDLISPFGTKQGIVAFKAPSICGTLSSKVDPIVAMLKSNKTIQYLDLSLLKLNAGSITKIISALRLNRTLQDFTVCVERINAVDVIDLANILNQKRSAMKSLRLIVAQYDDDLSKESVCSLFQKATPLLTCAIIVSDL